MLFRPPQVVAEEEVGDHETDNRCSGTTSLAVQVPCKTLTVREFFGVKLESIVCQRAILKSTRIKRVKK